MRAATWNVNSVNARIERLLAFLQRWQPDLVALQELKCTEEKFPFAALESVGYQAAVYGQKTYNGVAVLHKKPPTEVMRSFGDDVDDPMARFICARFAELDFISAYIPNGKDVGLPQYTYKLEWLKRLKKFLKQNLDLTRPVLLCGDFNVAPTDLDVHDPKQWEEKILCSTPERLALQGIMDTGFIDLFRSRHLDAREFSWWDYRALGFQMNKGLRIDFILGTEAAAQRVEKIWIDREERKGEKPSDHAPVLVELK